MYTIALASSEEELNIVVSVKEGGGMLKSDGRCVGKALVGVSPWGESMFKASAAVLQSREGSGLAS